jgi:hypothetical protein
MHKKFVIILSIVAVIIMTVLAACAPAAAPAPSPKPPAATPKPVEPPFTAATYTNDQYNFSVMYPKTWIKTDFPANLSIFRAMDPQQVPVLQISLFEKANPQKGVEALWAIYSMTDIKYIVQDQDIKLQDGKTPAKYTVYTSKAGTSPLRTYSVNVEKGDKAINFAITTVEGMQDEALFKAIINTIVFK